jgi:hypothetical protein
MALKPPLRELVAREPRAALEENQHFRHGVGPSPSNMNNVYI